MHVIKTPASKNDIPQTVPILRVRQETPLVRRYTLPISVGAMPGQFVNVWIPGLNERPMSVSFDDGKLLTLAVAGVGNTTKHLAQMKVGDFLGIRGPYGTHFTWQPGERIAMIAGGYGSGPLYFCASKAIKDGCAVDFFLGARSKDHLLFANDIKKLNDKKLNNVRLVLATDDGSAGFRGYNVGAFEAEMKKGEKYDRIMTVGPEPMMKAVLTLAEKHGIPSQISVERYMKCGFGICGNCCVDDLGITTCINGPVMDGKTVAQMKEFGVYHRDDVGEKHYF